MFGDFNVSHYYKHWLGNEIDRLADLLHNFAEYNGFNQYNFILNNKDRLLDLVFGTSYCDVLLAVEPLIQPSMYHPPLQIICEFYLQKLCKERGEGQGNRWSNEWYFDRELYPVLKYYLSFTDWSLLLMAASSNDAVERFTMILEDEFSRVFERKKGKLNGKKYPAWMKREVVCLIERKDYYKDLFNKTNSRFHQLELRAISNRVKDLIERDKQLYLKDIQNRIKVDPMGIWKYKDKLLGKESPGLVLQVDGRVVSGIDEIVNKFATYFCTVFEPCNVNDLSRWLVVDGVGLDHSLTPGVYDYVTVEMILIAMSKLRARAATGSDGVPGDLVKFCKNEFCYPLTIIYRLIISTCIFPDTWKLTRITPIFKGVGKRDIVGNHRPVAVPSVWAKVFEMCVYEIIMTYFKPHVAEQQHGFLPGRSTVTNLLVLKEYIHVAVEQGYQVDVVYTDFAKAFDKVSFPQLLTCLEDVGVTYKLVSLLATYLWHRGNFVLVNGVRSNMYYPTSGVPQGSNLGPLLYLIFINSIMSRIQCPLLFFADDAKLFYKVMSPVDAQHLQQCLDVFLQLCNDLQLKLNYDKCEVVTYCRKTKGIINFEYKLNNFTLKRSAKKRDLGVIFDAKLTFVPHISSMVSSACRILGLLMRISKQLSDIDFKYILSYIRA